MNTITLYRQMNFFEIIHKLRHFLYALRLLNLNVEAHVLSFLILKDYLLAIVIANLLGYGLHFDVVKLEHLAVNGERVGLNLFRMLNSSNLFCNILFSFNFLLWSRVVSCFGVG